MEGNKLENNINAVKAKEMGIHLNNKCHRTDNTQALY